MKRKQIIIDIDERLRDSAKNLAVEFDVSMKQLIKIAIIDLLKKHNKEIPVDEL